MGRNFANKLWNAARFLLLNLDGYTPGAMRLEELPIEDRWILSRLATTTAAVTEQSGGLPLQRGGADDLRLHLVGVLRLVRRDEQGPADPKRERGTAPLAQRVLVGVLDAHPAPGAADHAVRGRVDLAGAGRGGVRARPAGPGAGRRERGHRAVAGVPADVARRRDGNAHGPDAGPGAQRARGAQSLHGRSENAAGRVRALRRGDGRRLPGAGAVHHHPGRRRPSGVRPGHDQAEAGGDARPCGFRGLRVARSA